MINPAAESFFYLKTSAEAAEVLAQVLSERTMLDIEEVTVISQNYSSDIEAQNKMDFMTQHLLDAIQVPHQATTELNPVFQPGEINISELFEPGDSQTMVRFTAVDGNFFTQKIVQVENLHHTNLITAKCLYAGAELPSYDEILESNSTPLFN